MDTDNTTRLVTAVSLNCSGVPTHSLPAYCRFGSVIEGCDDCNVTTADCPSATETSLRQACHQIFMSGVRLYVLSQIVHKDVVMNAYTFLMIYSSVPCRILSQYSFFSYCFRYSVMNHAITESTTDAIVFAPDTPCRCS